MQRECTSAQIVESARLPAPRHSDDGESDWAGGGLYAVPHWLDPGYLNAGLTTQPNDSFSPGYLNAGPVGQF